MISSLAGACTPISERQPPTKQQADSADAGPAAASGDSSNDSTGATAPPTPRDDVGEPCDELDARSCDRMDPLIPLVCEQSIWQADEPCGDNQRCDPTPGPKQGMCRRVSTECRDHDIGVAFCSDEGQIVTCNEGLQPLTQACDENERCAEIRGRTRCVCMPGFKDEGDGCREATGCEEGSCDPQTACSIVNGEGVCSPCPDGFNGSGEAGCTPMLVAVEGVNAELDPTFSPERTRYDVTLPLLAQTLTLSIAAPPGVEILIDGEPVPAGELWTSPVLQIGEREFEIEVASGSGMSETYRIRVERQGLEDAYLKASAPASGDLFGHIVAMSGETLLITAPYEDSAAGGVNPAGSSARANNSGAAYVFVREAGRWVQQAMLKAAVPTSNDFFGTGAAISGDMIAVGAVNDEPLTEVPPATRPGAVFIYERSGTSWAQTATLTSSGDDAIGDLFGFAVAFWGDEVFVGANKDNSGAEASGAVYVYKRMGADWKQTQKLKPSRVVNSAIFGTAIAVEDDTLAVSASNEALDAEGRGAAYIFRRRDGEWVEDQKVTTPAPDNRAGFGFTLALSGDTLVVGAPHYDLLTDLPPGAAYVFERGSDDLFIPSAVLQAPSPRSADWFGFQVAVLGDTMAVTAMGDDSGARGLQGDPARTDANRSGAVYLYARRGMTWQRSTYIKASNSDPGDAFGFGVALTPEWLAISGRDESSAGVPDDGSAARSGAGYVFR